MLKQSLHILLVNATIEYRSRSALNTALAFALSSLLTAVFAINANEQSSQVKSGLLWLIILFASLNAISRLFIAERDQHTLDLLKLNSSAMAIYWGKLIFNFAFLLLFSIPTFAAFSLMVGLGIESLLPLLGLIILSSLSLASATTLLAAIVAESDRSAAIFPVISVPVLFPALILAVELTTKCLFDAQSPIEWSDFLPLIGFCGAIISAGSLLFQHIWED